MTEQRGGAGSAMCRIYMSPDEQRLLGRIALRRGIGRDYLTLCADNRRADKGRPIPRWLARDKPPARTPSAPNRPHAARQERHCRSCSKLARTGQDGDRTPCLCTAGVWTALLSWRSLLTSRRIRQLSRDCACYVATTPRERRASHHCRACSDLVEAGTTDVRFVCARGVWSNPMKPQSVNTARRISRLSAACPHFAARSRCGVAS